MKCLKHTRNILLPDYWTENTGQRAGSHPHRREGFASFSWWPAWGGSWYVGQGAGDSVLDLHAASWIGRWELTGSGGLA